MRLNVPSTLAATEITSVSVASYKPTVTGLLAFTCPVRVPLGRAVDVGDGDPTAVEVAVADPSGVCVAVSDPFGVEVAVTDPSGVDVAVTDPSGVCVAVADPSGVEVAVADPSGVEVAEPSGVGVSEGAAVGVAVAVGALPVTVRLVPVDGRLVSEPFPVETRTVHSIDVCPACKPVALKVKAVPLVVALLPLLPAIAKIKLPLCGLLNAVAGSEPNKPTAVTLPTATRFAS